MSVGGPVGAAAGVALPYTSINDIDIDVPIDLLVHAVNQSVALLTAAASLEIFLLPATTDMILVRFDLHRYHFP